MTKIMWPWNGKFLLYHPIEGGDESVQRPRESAHERSTSRVNHLLVVLAITQIFTLAVLGLVAYNFQFLSRYSKTCLTSMKTNAIDGSSFRKETMAFMYNRTFSERPSPETDAAWESIFPPRGGFFNDSEIAPTGGSLAVYHQLHCLDGIRHAYYTIFDAMIAGKKVAFSEVEDYSTDWHTRHCLDFLRQMLMCNADLTVETVDPALGGIRGFGKGREHECVVWEDVKNWSVAQQQKLQ